MDLTKSIEPRSDQFNAEDLLTGPRTFTITDVRAGTEEQPVRVFLAEGPEGRPWIPAKTMRRLLVLAWGAESDAYIGKRVTLYRDPTIRFGPDTPGGIRISHMSGIGRKPLVAQLTEKRGKRVPYKVEPLPEDAPAPAKVPGPLDQLVWAMNAAKIPQVDRLDYCRRVLQFDVKDPRDLTPEQMASVVESLQETIAYETEQENQNG
jgi:hypothetical protein